MINSNNYLSVNGTDLSGHVDELKVILGATGEDNTRHGNSLRAKEASIPEFAIEGTFYQSVTVTTAIWSLITGGSAITVIAKQNAASGTNNTYTCTNMIYEGEFHAIGGSGVGQTNKTPFRFVPTKDTVVTPS